MTYSLTYSSQNGKTEVRFKDYKEVLSAISIAHKEGFSGIAVAKV